MEPKVPLAALTADPPASSDAASGADCDGVPVKPTASTAVARVVASAAAYFFMGGSLRYFRASAELPAVTVTESKVDLGVGVRPTGFRWPGAVDR
jgi:hypothetical protein